MLKNDLIAKLDGMLAYVAYIEERSPQIIADYRARLEDKVRDLLGDTNIDEGRIAMETTIYADKLCVDEEIVRLKSHIEATRTTLVNGGSVGRKLDFIAQEMNREANTILSKANDLLISNTAIDLKTDIEKVREQIQNIELIGEHAMSRLINIGFGNMVNAAKIVAIISPDSAPSKRIVRMPRMKAEQLMQRRDEEPVP